MKKASFLVTKSIPGIAAKGEIIRVSENGILVGRWLSISKYPQLMESRHSLRPPFRNSIFSANSFAASSWRKALAMKNASFLVTNGIPGIAAKDEIIKVSDHRIFVGRWLSMSKYPQLMESRDSLRPASSSGVWVSKRITPLEATSDPGCSATASPHPTTAVKPHPTDPRGPR